MSIKRFKRKMETKKNFHRNLKKEGKAFQKENAELKSQGIFSKKVLLWRTVKKLLWK